MKKVLMCLFAMLVGLMTVSVVHAQTPDGETPAEEGVCDVLIGATPGLYGLCIAFCEAQDLNSIETAIESGNMPGEKILMNYNRKKTADDPEMPCIVSASECPCFNTQVCKATSGEVCDAPDGFTNINQLFEGRDCGTLDNCFNSSLYSVQVEDRCESVDLSSHAFAAYFPNNQAGYCRVWERDPEGPPDTYSKYLYKQLDGPTAALCISELNDYDGNTAGVIDPCGLGD